MYQFSALVENLIAFHTLLFASPFFCYRKKKIKSKQKAIIEYKTSLNGANRTVLFVYLAFNMNIFSNKTEIHKPLLKKKNTTVISQSILLNYQVNRGSINMILRQKDQRNCKYKKFNLFLSGVWDACARVA